MQRLKAGRLPLTYPLRDELDECPLVPFLFADDGSNLYDSTAIAHWLDHHHGTDSRRLIPRRPACELIARLIDDHFDEFGLYVAHHHRWVTSAKDDDAGQRVADQMAKPLPALGRRSFAQWFARRQVRRLPYLFSVAPLLNEIVRIHVPLMEQKERAYERHKAAGQTRFNEAAFDRNEALYDGELLGRPFRSVAKTFQVKGWRSLKARYLSLETAHRAALPVDVRDAFDDAVTCR